MSEELTLALNNLGKKMGDILVMVVAPEKLQTAADIMNTYSKEFYTNIKDEKSPDKISESFDHFVNTELSVCETLGIAEKQWRPTRKLILNEMYKFRKEILKLEPKKK